jgi:creatine kinase
MFAFLRRRVLGGGPPNAGDAGGEGEAAATFKLPEIDPNFDTWLAAQLAASPNDCKDTDEFKYITFTELPPWTDKHKSLMRKNMTQAMFDKLKDIKSSKGYSLSNGIQAGVLRPHLGVGFTCGDEECFELFKDIINPIVKGWHEFDPATQTHKSDLNYERLVFTADDLALFTKYVKSTRIRAARNISGFSLPAGSTKEDRLAVEAVLKEAFSLLPKNLQGTYFPLGDLTDEQEDALQAGGFLFQKPGPMQLLGAAGAGRDWPSGRGIFHNPAKTVLCWCNEEDQCRIIAMENGGDVKGVFTRFCQLSNAIKEASEKAGKKLMEHPNYGFLGTCPSNLGTGLRGSVMIVLPELNKDPHKLEEICAGFDLQPRGSSGEHSAAVGAKWDISNKQRIGFTEVQLVQKMIDGVKKLIALEEEMAAAAGGGAGASAPAASRAKDMGSFTWPQMGEQAACASSPFHEATLHLSIALRVAGEIEVEVTRISGMLVDGEARESVFQKASAAVGNVSLSPQRLRQDFSPLLSGQVQGQMDKAQTLAAELSSDLELILRSAATAVPEVVGRECQI